MGLQYHFRCQEACFISAMIYVDRVWKVQPSFVDQLSIHLLFATSLVVSVKFHDDEYYSNKFYAKGIGVGLVELNCLETKFLPLIQWNLDISPDEYSYYLHLLAVFSSHAATAHE